MSSLLAARLIGTLAKASLPRALILNRSILKHSKIFYYFAGTSLPPSFYPFVRPLNKSFCLSNGYRLVSEGWMGVPPINPVVFSQI